ncbi:hypothetical protein TDB9533_04138 [Thalassocella blandensis]|nr:hypothetical protein TDB9533_04138 [Thalassocella blandensis]
MVKIHHVRRSFIVAMMFQCTQVFSQELKEEEVFVQGIRTSLQQSVDDKRHANVVMDSVNAEDIGKFPDQNVAESLQRITGVQIDRGFDNTPGDNFGSGEGTQVSVRGIRPDLNLVTWNGNVISANTNGRNFDFGILAPELVQKLEVYKTPRADLSEGAIGAIVNLKTHRPFDFEGEKITASGQWEYADINHEDGYRLSGLYSNVYAEEKVGFLLSANFADNKLQRHRYETAGWGPADIDGESGLIPYNFRWNNRNEWKERESYYAAFQFKPNEDLEVNLSYLTSEEVNHNFGPQQILPSDVPQVELGNGVLVDGSFVSYDVEATAPHRRLLVINRFNTTQINTLALDATLHANDWDIYAAVTDSSGKFDQTMNFTQFWGQDDFSMDFSQGNPPLVEMDDFYFQPLTNYFINVANFETQFFDNDQQAVQLDFTRPIAFSVFHQMDVGIKYTRQQHDAGRIADAATPEEVNHYTLDMFVDPDRPVLYNVFEPGRIGGVPDGFVNVDVQAVVAELNQYWQDQVQRPVDRPATYQIDEDIVAAYFKADFAYAKWSGNLGVRYVDTQQDTVGYEQDSGSPIQTENTYSDILPSVNLQYLLRDDVIVRAAIAKTMSRPSFTDLNPGGVIIPLEERAVVGNARLEPFRADQFDLSMEWYFQEGAIFSLAYFFKDVESFIIKDVEQGVIPGFESLGEFAIETSFNGPGAEINGVELSIQRNFDFFPEPFDGFGAVLNYTFIEGELEEGGGDIPGLSQYSYNAVLFYEKQDLSVRLAYNYRDAYVVFQGVRGIPYYRDDRSQLDVNASYAINQHVSVVASGRNITDEPTYDYHGTANNFSAYHISGAIYSLGVRVNF